MEPTPRYANVGLPRVLLFLAAFAALWLGLATLGIAPNSTIDAGSQSAIGSRWASFLGIPVGLIGALFYGTLAAVAPSTVKGGSIPASMGVFCAFIIPLSTILFTIAQIISIGALSILCTVALCCATTGAVLILAQRRSASEGGALLSAPERLAPALAMVTFGILMLVQAISPATTSHVAVSIALESAPAEKQPEHHQRTQTVSLHRGKFSVDPSHFNVVPSSGAGPFVTIITDYGCEHCHQLQRRLRAIQAVTPEKFGIVELPAAHSYSNNDTNRLLLALKRIDPKTFAPSSATFSMDALLPTQTILSEKSFAVCRRKNSMRRTTGSSLKSTNPSR
ncbi:MAG: vitamin K epoxide reductase family protein [Verrucomicrobiales bacterium]